MSEISQLAEDLGQQTVRKPVELQMSPDVFQHQTSFKNLQI